MTKRSTAWTISFDARCAGICTQLPRRLRASGYVTTFAEDGMGAISAARKQKPDLILLDLGLPAGDGFIVLERLKRNTEVSHIPVIVISARDPEGNAERAKKAGAYAYLQKPADADDLLDSIAQTLEHDADLLFGRKLPARSTADLSHRRFARLLLCSGHLDTLLGDLAPVMCLLAQGLSESESC